LKVKDEFLYFRTFQTAGLPCYRKLLYASIAVFILIFSFLSFQLHCSTMQQLCTTVSSPSLTDRVPLHIISRKHITNPLTSWNRDLLDHLYLQLVNKFSTLYEARRSFLCLQEATTCPIPGTDHSRPHNPILFP
jgi:hypothetical protein